MVRSMYAAIAGLRAHQSKMDVIGNNIANVNTPGYKTARATFQESIYQTSAQSTGANDTFGGTNAMQVGYGSKLGAIDLVFATSNLSPTGQATDCMIDGDGFFVVVQKFKEITAGGGNAATIVDGAVSVTTDGRVWDANQSNLVAPGTPAPAASLGQLNLSRVGDFKLDNEGYLTDKNGNCVYGYALALNADGTPADAAPGKMEMTVLRPIRVPLLKEGNAANAELPTWGNVAIDAKGNVTCTLGNNDTPYTLGRVAVAVVPNPNGLEHTDGPYYQIGGNAGTATAYTPQSASAGKLVTGGLEAANVDLANEFSEMITTQRGFQANSRIITVTDQMLEELVNLKR